MSRTDRSRLNRGFIQPAAPEPKPVWPRGDLSRAGIAEVVTVAMQVFPTSGHNLADRRAAVRVLLERLQAADTGNPTADGDPGRTWQQRWEHANRDGSFFADKCESDTLAYKMLLSLRVLQMDLQTMRLLPAQGYADKFRQAQCDPLLDRFFDHVAAMEARRDYRLGAVFDVVCALTVFGIELVELTPAAMLHYAWECRRLGVGLRHRNTPGRFSGQLAWVALIEAGRFPPDTPPTLHAAGKQGQRPVADLVDRYPITNRPVRQLLIDYLTRRATELDYATVVSLVRHVAGYFWSRIEQLNPAQHDLNVPGHIYDRWRAGINVRVDGTPRLSVDPILLSVRSFYLDLHTWAAAEPARWAAWVAPCPIAPSDFAGSARRARRVKERSAARTRVRQPLLADLVSHVTEKHEQAKALLQAASAAAPHATFAVAGRTYTRTWTPQDNDFRTLNRIERVRVRIESSTEDGDDAGQIINVALAEEYSFWDWAIVEVLRHSGVRIEEMLELSQLSVRRYTRPNGETVGLLVIAPSKSDRERVIPMAPELFAVIAALIRRHTNGNNTDGNTGKASIPLVSRFDPADRVHSPPMPLLFQRIYGSRRHAIGQAFVVQRLRARCAELAQTNPEFAGAAFTPHDFRRLFATDLVNNGLPIHIGAALLGHLNLETTRGYVAVFEEDLVRHYQTFLQHRRDRRPAEEYRPTTTQEWDEFEQHFDKRKVELGNCGRPYQTPCVHEHACLRCPMLLVSPTMLDRLNVIEKDLHQRRRHADDQGWLGEIEGIDITLAHLDTKRGYARRLTANPAANASKLGPVSLGLPAPPRKRRT